MLAAPVKKYTVDVLSENYYELYEKFLIQCDESIFYYSVRYKKFIENLLNCSSKYLISWSDNEIVGVLPLMVKSGKYGDIYNSLPYFGSNGGVISIDVKAGEVLIKHYNQLVEDSSVAASTVIENPLSSDNHQYISDMSDKRIGQWTKLVGAENELMSSFDSSARRNIRKAKKEGVEVKIDNDGFEFLMKTHLDNMEKIGGNAKKEKFFELVPKFFEAGKDFNIYVSYYDEKPIAALLLFYFNKTVEYFTPVVVDEFRNMQALPATIYQAMLDSFNSGYRWWNWGGTWLSQDGVYRFKKKWGALDKVYNYHIKINNDVIRTAQKNELINAYPGFYIKPF